jgi:hypothetical protein
LSDLGFSDAAVTLAQSLAGTVLSVSGSRLGLRLPVSHSPPGYLESLGPLGSLSFAALSLSVFILFILFILVLWVSRMARRLLFQRPFDACYNSDIVRNVLFTYVINNQFIQRPFDAF